MKKILFMLLAIAGFVACDSKEPSFELKPQLLVDKAEIIANGEDCVTFAVKFDGKDVTADATIHFADTHGPWRV